MKKEINLWFLFWLSLAWLCESMMDTIDHHQHSSWIFRINWSDNIMMWLKSEWVNRDKFLFDLYDGWHTFKGLMLIFQSIAVAVLSSKWRYCLIFLLSYFLIHEIFYGDLLIGGR